MPTTNYLLVPSVSSERRLYVPIGFMDSEAIASNLVFIIPNATLAHFAVLTSSVHMAWMRAVCGRLEMRYRYSKDVVYNNFPWPQALGAQASSSATITLLTQTAQAILDARAVLALYGLSENATEEQIVSELFRCYEMLTRA